MTQKQKILDCTLRDGGYYTNWDFPQELVNHYFEAMNSIPEITHVEIGYRSLPMDEYFGEYFYCPPHVLQRARAECPDKKIAIMLNEKNTRSEDLAMLLNPCVGYVDMVRLAIAPVNFERANKLAKEILGRGFEVGMNVMYMSKWIKEPNFMDKIKDANATVFSLIDSYGSVYPQEVADSVRSAREATNVPLGFHGHNNLELALANTLTALDSGCEIVDTTLTGMGRGAGNLRTELLLTCLDSRNTSGFNYSSLTPVVTEFEQMQKEYCWGTSLPYMISGAFSLPQKDVMSWISKRRYTTKSIINALQQHNKQSAESVNVPTLKIDSPVQNAVIVGGGATAHQHAHSLGEFCRQHPDTVIIHAGTRYIAELQDAGCKQYVCLLGSEGYKMERFLHELEIENYCFVIEPSPRQMGTVIPQDIEPLTFELERIDLFEDYPDSLFTIALQVSTLFEAMHVYLFGFDGYDIETNNQMLEVAQENQFLINSYMVAKHKLVSLTPTSYQNLKHQSIYGLL